jgi:Lar family restriction alleviation protein
VERQVNRCTKLEDSMKPCPFCKSEDLGVVEDGATVSYYVLCKGCWAQGPHSFKDEEDAKKAWNDRQ